MFLEAHGEDGAGSWSPGESRDLPGSRDFGRQFSVQQVSAFSLLEGEEGDPTRGLAGSQDDSLASPHRHTSVKLGLCQGGEEQLVGVHHGVKLDISAPGYELTRDKTNINTSHRTAPGLSNYLVGLAGNPLNVQHLSQSAGDHPFGNRQYLSDMKVRPALK